MAKKKEETKPEESVVETSAVQELYEQKLLLQQQNQLLHEHVYLMNELVNAIVAKKK